MSEEEKSRYKRNAEPSIDCHGTAETRCCRHELIVDFEEFGWDWVIAPKSYKAYYCSGECPMRYLQRYIHTHVAQTAGIGPCCTPTEMKPIFMVYFNDLDEAVASYVPQMQVGRCGCA